MPDQVLVISQVPPPHHGSTVMTQTLLDVLTELGRRVHLVDRRFSRSVGEVGRVTIGKAVAVPSLLLRLALAPTGARSTCIFFCTNRPFSFLVDILLATILRVRRIRTINYVHTSGYRDLASKGLPWRILVRYLLRTAQRTVCLSPELAQDVLPFVSESSIAIIPNAVVAPEKVVDRTVRGAANSTVLFFSNLLEEKGADTFVQMALVLSADFPEVRFRLVGSPGEGALVEELAAQVERAGVRDRFEFAGPLVGPAKWSALRSAKVLVFPSRYRYEAQPLTVIEAFSVGTPVIATRIGALPSLIDDGKNGFLLDGDIVAEGEQAIRRLLTDAALRGSMEDAAVATYAAKHSLPAYASAWAAMLREGD